MKPILRKARKSDFESVKDFIKEHNEKEFPQIHYETIRKRAEASYKTHVGKEGTFVLVYDKKIIGYLSIGTVKNKKLNLIQGEIYMIHIAKEFRGKGYANMLMVAAEEYFKKKKADFCIVTTSFTNEISQSLYKKYKFMPWRVTFKKLIK